MLREHRKEQLRKAAHRSTPSHVVHLSTDTTKAGQHIKGALVARPFVSDDLSTSATQLLRTNASVVRDLRPARHLGLEEFVECRAPQELRLDALLDDSPPHIRVGERLGEQVFEPGKDGLRRLRRRAYAVPGRDYEIRKARFAHGWDIGQLRRALRGSDGKPSQLSRSDVNKRGGQVVELNVDCPPSMSVIACAIAL